MRKWKDIAEIIGIVAIVLSLFFVGLELRQNTVAVKAASIDGLASLTQEYFFLIASDAELTRIVYDGLQDMTALDEYDRQRFLWVELSRAVRLQIAFLQWQRGTLGNQDWLFYKRFVCTQSGKESWPLTKEVLTPDFVAYSESC